jgi:hippurate hydrolase
MALGAFATRAGPITASESLFSIAISSRGGHAALPHMGVDAITVGAEMVGALQTIVSRKLDPSVNGVVSVTEFVTDGRRNILPGTALLSGDARALTPELTKQIESRMRQIAKGIAMAHEVSADVTFDTIFPPSINAAAPVAHACAAASATVGTSLVDCSCAPKLFSEDFAHLAAAREGCFILIGNGTSAQNTRPLHASDYDFADAALPIGASYWVNLIEVCLP